MNFLDINNCKIAYQEYNSHLPETLLFIHGNSHSSQSFINQQREEKLSHFRLIFIDLPGHGNSSPLENYSLPIFAKIINDFINKLGLVRYAIVGHSLGGHIGIHLLKESTPLGLFIVGTPPQKKPFSGEGFLSNTKASILNLPKASDEELQALCKEFLYNDIDTSLFISDYKKTDPNFRVQIIPSVLMGDYEDEVQILKNFQGVSFGIGSENDLIVSSVYMKDVFDEVNGAFFLADGGHSNHATSAKKFNNLLNLFADKVFVNHNSLLATGFETIEVLIGY